jgi:hypothetical protein
MSLLAVSSRPRLALDAGLPLEVLGDIAAGLAAAVSGTGDEVPIEPGQLRGFVRLLESQAHESQSYEAWLIAWAPSGALELHDHGGSAGAVHVVGGELVELYTDLADRHPLRSRTVGAGESLALPPTRVHEVWNPGPDTALSVYVYSPRITTMTFFDRNLEPARAVSTSVPDE